MYNVYRKREGKPNKPEREQKMKLIDTLGISQNAIMETEYNCFEHDVTRDDDEYKSVEFKRTINAEYLKKELGYVFRIIQESDGDDADKIETVDEYIAVLENGEKVSVFVPDLWR